MTEQLRLFSPEPDWKIPPHLRRIGLAGVHACREILRTHRKEGTTCPPEGDD